MKNNRISTRVLAVFAAVLLIMTLSIPTFAATEYVFSSGESGGDLICPTYVPEGRYSYKVTLKPGLAESMGISRIEPGPPLDFRYETTDNGDYCTLSANLTFIFKDGSSTVLNREIYLSSFDDGKNSFSQIAAYDASFDSIIVTRIDVPTLPSISDSLPADALPSVFNEIFSLLPLALGALAGFIAIRKGIAYLQNVLHSS